MDTTFPEYLGERNGGEVGGSGREENATIVFRSEARLKRSEPFLARRRSHRHSRRRRSRAAPWQPAEPAAADQIPVAKGRIQLAPAQVCDGANGEFNQEVRHPASRYLLS